MSKPLPTALALILSSAPLTITIESASMDIGLNSAYADSCFVAGTKVRMADGTQRSIETLQIGSRVLGTNGRSNVVRGIEIDHPLKPHILVFLNAIKWPSNVMTAFAFEELFDRLPSMKIIGDLHLEMAWSAFECPFHFTTGQRGNGNDLVRPRWTVVGDEAL